MALWPLLQLSLRGLQHGAHLHSQYGARSHLRLFSSLQLNSITKHTPDVVQHAQNEPASAAGELTPSYLDLNRSEEGDDDIAFRTELEGGEMLERGSGDWEGIGSEKRWGKLEMGQKRGNLETGQSSPGAVEVPRELTEAIQQAVAGYSPRSLRHLTRQLSEGLHDHSRGWLSDPPKPKHDLEADSEEPIRIDKQKQLHKALSAEQEHRWKDVLYPTAERVAPRYTDGHVAAYAAARMPATYAALVHVLQELRWQRPEFRPERVLDFGSGTGSALWAARAVWGTWPKQAVAVEKARGMAQLGDALLTGAEDVPRVHRLRSLDALLKSRVGGHQHYDMVVAAYALGEQGDAAERRRILRKLWARTKSLLVIVEAGTPRGFEIVLEAREALLKNGDKRASRRGDSQVAHVVAPCPHDGTCPMSGGTQWCHFVQRLQRTSLQRVAKRADAALRAHEDEKFSYVIIQRGPRDGKRRSSERALKETAGADARLETASAAEASKSCDGEADVTRDTDDASHRIKVDVSRGGESSADRPTCDESLMADGGLSAESVLGYPIADGTKPLQVDASGTALPEATDSRGTGTAEAAPLEDEETGLYRHGVGVRPVAEGDPGGRTLGPTGNEELESSESERFGGNEGSDRLENHSLREWARLIGPPRQRHGHVILDLCCPGEDGTGQLERRTVSKGLNGEPGSKERYANARRAKWGSRWHWDVD